MTATAARLGSSPLTLDWSNLARGQLSSSNFDEFSQAWARLKTRFETGDVGFYGAPSDNKLSQAEESVALAQEILSQGRFTDCMFLGIGGSALGPISLLSALEER